MENTLSNELDTGVVNSNSSNSSEKENLELVTNYQYGGNTPIWIRGQEGKWAATIGMHRITPVVETEGEVLNMLDAPNAVICLNIAIAINESQKGDKKNG